MTQNCNCHGSGGDLSQTVAATLERPRYAPGLILEDSDLNAAVDYTHNLNRMLFRHLFGCGVICGLTVTADETCGGITIIVSPGLALDGCGDPVELPKKVEINVDEKTALKWETQVDPKQRAFWVVLCGKEKLCAPRSLVCDADDFDGVVQHTRIRAQSEITVTPVNPKCICGCPSRDVVADGAAMQAMAGTPHGPAAPDDDPCQRDHERRDDCVEDCGCGTACDCGCCVLLAKVIFDKIWIPQHAGQRRLVRPAMVRDHEPGRTAPPAAPADDIDTGYRDAATGRSMTRAEVMERLGDYVVKSGGVLEEIRLAEVGLSPGRRALSAGVAAGVAPAAAADVPPEKASTPRAAGRKADAAK